jgi:hypothetical protein
MQQHEHGSLSSSPVGDFVAMNAETVDRKLVSTHHVVYLF